MSLVQSRNIILPTSATGVFSKKEAASLIASGCSHIHSSQLGQRDPLAVMTYQSIDCHQTACYPWEKSQGLQQVSLDSSNSRYTLINQISNSLQIKPTTQLCDRVTTCLEELFTNSLFHAYHLADGSEKYNRNESVVLNANEKILIEFARSSEGIFISVRDFGEGLPFPKIQNYFRRCYEQRDQSQIETKNSGAGLGLYVVFESASHLKIVSTLKQGTLVSCWFSKTSAFDPNYFSFNFFQGEIKK
ncbi:MAG: ATP-binding protein [Deltaproteobacteria bacterium]|nr:ATP-binding protein [Deltaproteobacteria bacterium]